MSHLPVLNQRLVLSGRIFSIFSILIFSFSFFTVNAQNVGVNTLEPKAGLHIVSNDGLLATGTFGSGIVQDSGVGTRLMWIPYLGAFRFGGLNGENDGNFTQRWDPDSIGTYSFAGGINTKANGSFAFAFGNRNTSSGGFSTAIGGFENVASGQYSFATGLSNRAPSAYESVFGSYATLYTPLDPLNFNGQDRVFTIGVGYDQNHRYNAMTILKNGKVGINTTTPLYPLHVYGESAIDSGRLLFINTGSSIFIGQEAGQTDDRTNNNNVLIGNSAGRNIINGNQNVGIGSGALANGGNSSDNIAIGASVLTTALTGNENIGIGTQTLQYSSTGWGNVALGSFSMRVNSTGHHNTALGQATLLNNGTGFNNVAIGSGALYVNNNQTGNLAAGQNAGNANTGSYNTFLGNESGTYNITGHHNVFIGNQSGQNNTTSNTLIIDNSDTSSPLIYGDFANNRVFINDSLGSKYFQMTTGAQDGYLLRSNANGHASWTDPATLNLSQWISNGFSIYNQNAGNVGIGTSVPTSKLHLEGNFKVSEGKIEMVNADHGTYLGQYAGFVDFIGNTNESTFVGYSAGQGNSTGGENTAVGAYALNENINGGFNAAFGNGALKANHSGSFNVGIGYAALTEGVTGSRNIGIGNFALKRNNGENNITLGAETGADNIAGSNNLFLGAGSGEHNTGSGNVFLGFNSGKNESGTDKLYIDNSDAATPLIYGDFSKNKVIIYDSLTSKYFQMTNGAGANKILQSNANGQGTWVDANALFSDVWTSSGNNIYNNNTSNVGIGTTNPTEKLQVDGNLKIYGGKISFENTGYGTFVGKNAGINDINTLFNVNTFIGFEAGMTNTSGAENTVLGGSAFKLNLTGNQNTALGGSTLASNTTGGKNLAGGYGSLTESVTGTKNIGLGYYALKKNNGGDNISIGEETGAMNTTGSFNVFIGTYAGEQNTGSGNVFLGSNAGRQETGSNKLYISNSNTTTPLMYGDFSTKRIFVNDSLGSKYLKMTNGATNGYLLRTDANGNGSWVAPSVVFSDDWNSNGGNIYNANTINVGIGLTTPLDQLHVKGNLRVENGRIPVTGTGQSIFIGEDAGLSDDRTTNANVFIGQESGKSNTTGENDIAIGAFAMDGSTSASNSIAIGKDALGSATFSGNTNLAIGNYSLAANTSGGDNVAFGQNTLEANTVAIRNVALGNYAMDANTSGSFNTVIGHEALGSSMNGEANVALGNNAGYSSTGSNNTFLGAISGYLNTGSGNVFIGHEAGFNETGNNKLYISNTTTSSPLLYGDFSIKKLTINDSLSTKQIELNGGRISYTNTGQSVFVGNKAGLNDDLTTNANVFIGQESGKSNTTGENDIAIGAFAMDGSSSASNNIAIGKDALGSATFSGNTNLAIGNYSLAANTSGGDNVAFGQNTLGANTVAIRNVALGNYAMDANTSGSFNTVIGHEALGSSINGEANVALGNNAGYSSTGSNNTFLGAISGYLNTGSGNVFIGHEAGFNETGNNKLYISNTNTSSPLLYGDFSLKKLTINDSLATGYFQMTHGAANGYLLKSNSSGRASWTSLASLFSDETAFNLFIGANSGSAITSGTDNTAFGQYAGSSLNTGYENVAVGKEALQLATDALFNVAVGNRSLLSNITGDGNTALGWGALAAGTGNSNVGVGADVGSNNTSGARNVFMGYESGMNSTGSDNVFLGYRAGKAETGSNKLYIENSNSSSPMIYGDFSTNEVTINDSLTVNKELGVATSQPNSTFEVNGSVAAKFKTPLVAGTTNPDGTGMVWRYNSGTGSIILPAASTCANRMYVIINQTGSPRTITVYHDLTTTPQTTFGSSVALWLMSDGAEWWQIK